MITTLLITSAVSCHNSEKKNSTIISSKTHNSQIKSGTSTIAGKFVLFLRPDEQKFTAAENEEGIFETDSDFGFAITNTMDSLSMVKKYKGIKSDVSTERYIKVEDCMNCPKIIDRDTIWYGIILTGPDKEIKIISGLGALSYLEEINTYFGIK